ncbi:MAG: TldD/PmbA family protein [Bacteroidaceae bacterium]|nr:TldD/PmbA family protein [Bacteroidaceae bacterium]
MKTEIADKAMEMALDCGCQDVKVVLMQNQENTIQIQNGRTEKMQQSTATSLAFNLFIDGRDGFFYTNKLDAAELFPFIRQAVETTRLLEPDESRTLADASRYYKGNGPDLQNFDAEMNRVDPAEKRALAERNNARLTGKDPRIISAESHYRDRQHEAYYLISNGFKGSEQSSYCILSTIVTVEGRDGQHPMDGWGNTRIFYKDLPEEGLAEIALERTMRKIGQRPIKSGNYTMILESPVAGSLLQPLLNAMGGQALQQRTSFLSDRLDQQVASPLFSLVDDPLIPGTRGASLFDYDGVATSRRQLFEQGVLRTYFIDTPCSKKLGIPPTTQGIHHLIMEPGNHSLDDLMKEAGRAIMVTDLNGGNCDPTTGRFSYGIEGFLIEEGRIAQPVSGMNITGDMLSLWQNLIAVANDADPWETELIPSLTFRDVAFSGI